MKGIGNSAPADATLTITPPPCFSLRIARTARRVPSHSAVRSNSMTLLQLLVSSSKISPRSAMPALFTTRFRDPVLLTCSSNPRSRAALSVTSTPMALANGDPLAVAWPATVLALVRSRSVCVCVCVCVWRVEIRPACPRRHVGRCTHTHTRSHPHPHATLPPDTRARARALKRTDRPIIVTLHPSWASCSAIAAPIPAPAPVTIAERGRTLELDMHTHAGAGELAELVRAGALMRAVPLREEAGNSLSNGWLRIQEAGQFGVA